MSSSLLLRSLFLIWLAFFSTNVLSETFNVSTVPQLRQAFLDAALNGEGDFINLSPGIYKTTSDGLGTFRFSDAEPFYLFVTGSADDPSAVILDGDNTDQVLSLINSEDSRVNVSKLIIRNGKSSDCGSGLHADFDKVSVSRVGILNNLNGGGICAPYPYVTEVYIGDSVISGNTNSRRAGADLTAETIIIERTEISGNDPGTSYSAGGISLNSSPFTFPTSRIPPIIINSVVANNDGIGIKYSENAYDAYIINTTIVNNAGGGVDAQGIFVNNIFTNNNAFDVNDSGTFYNNYIDYSKLDASALLKDNILPREGDPDFADTEFRIGADSVVIDKGLDPNSNVFGDLFMFTDEFLQDVRDALSYDKDRTSRLIDSGSAIDIGAYEYHPANYPPVDLSGTIKTADGTEVCAMVLASGQYTFSCNPPGVFSLTDLPTAADGTVKRQIYADGFFPDVDTLTGSSVDAVVMTRSGTCPNYNTPYLPADVPGSAGKRINITGKVLLQNSLTPICAMVLSNGQYTFSCDGTGSYALNIPLDNNGQFKLQVYADGFAPASQVFDEFKAINDVRMARSTECQTPSAPPPPPPSP